MTKIAILILAIATMAHSQTAFITHDSNGNLSTNTELRQPPETQKTEPQTNIFAGRTDTFVRQLINMQIGNIHKLALKVKATNPQDWQHGTSKEWQRERDRCQSGSTQASTLLEHLDHSRVMEMYEHWSHEGASRVAVVGWVKRAKDEFDTCTAAFDALLNGAVFESDDAEDIDITKFTL